MSILVDKNTRLVVQGITGSAGAFHTRQCMDYGTNVVAGVTPGKGGQMFDGKVPVFDTVREARQKTDCNASMVFVPAPAASDSILEAVDAGVELVVCIRRNSSDGHDTSQSADAWKAIATDRTELSGNHHTWHMQNWHHARVHP